LTAGRASKKDYLLNRRQKISILANAVFNN